MHVIPKFQLNQEVLLVVPGVCRVVRVVRIVFNKGSDLPRYEVVGANGTVVEATDECLLPDPPTRDAAICELLKIREMIGGTGAGQDHTHAEVAVHALIGRLTEAHETLGIADARWRQVEDVVGMSDPVGAARALGVANDELTARVQELEEALAIEQHARDKAHAERSMADLALVSERQVIEKVTRELDEARAERRQFEQSLRARIVDTKAGASGSIVMDLDRPELSASHALGAVMRTLDAFDDGKNGDGPARVLAAAAILRDDACHVVAILNGDAHTPVPYTSEPLT